MPKIIKDIEDKILSAAQELFMKNGYQETDIRQIANKANIAVGTLYNYYRNKEELFQAAFRKKWMAALANLEAVVCEQTNPEERLKVFIQTLQQEIQGREKQGWKHLQHSFLCENNFEKLKASVFQQVVEILTKLNTLTSNIIADIAISYTGQSLSDCVMARLSDTLLINIFVLTNRFPQEPTENVSYLCNLVISMCRVGRIYE